MGDRLQAGKPSRYVASYTGQLSLAIPPWVGAMYRVYVGRRNVQSTSESWDVNRHTARCTSPVSVVWQCKLVSGWGLKKRRSPPPYGAYGSGRTLLYFSLPFSYYFTCLNIITVMYVHAMDDDKKSCRYFFVLIGWNVKHLQYFLHCFEW